ncbi:MAG: 30S ribosomal protein S4 [Methanocellales archaeon]|nr:30S ribosomal protein S4 [Methanocellales archaeon]MDD3421071.1 30S ribosomal protein S4 [Methanocellales archaeon]MDD4898224.1 30S ribosomal protein S4 [Methanocellales archaeon]MDD5446671.1 30S ribosomal protein S4 [Methanocellales archaeon]
MAYPGKKRKMYETPRLPWQATRIAEESELVKKYGLRNKRELWKTYSTLRKYRREARGLLAEINEPGKVGDYARSESKNVLGKLSKIGLLKKNAELDEILSLGVEDLLERRLQTLVHRNALANSAKQARQFIVHGHVAVAGRKINIPSYTVLKDEESNIGYYVGSPITQAQKEPIAQKKG